MTPVHATRADRRFARGAVVLFALIALLAFVAPPALADRASATSKFETRQRELENEGLTLLGPQGVGWHVLGVVTNTPVEKSFRLQADTTYSFVGGGDGSVRDLDLRVYDSSNSDVAHDLEPDATPRCEYTTTRSGAFKVRVTMASGVGLAWAYVAVFYRDTVDNGDNPDNPDNLDDAIVAIPIEPRDTPSRDENDLPLPRTGEDDPNFLLLAADAQESDTSDVLATIHDRTIAILDFDPRGTVGRDDGPLQPTVEFWFNRRGLAIADHGDRFSLARVGTYGYEDIPWPRGMNLERRSWNRLQIHMRDDKVTLRINGRELGSVVATTSSVELVVRVVSYRCRLRTAGNVTNGSQDNNNDVDDITELDARAGQIRDSEALGTLRGNATLRYWFRPDQRHLSFSISAIEFHAGDRALSLVDRGGRWVLQRLDGNGRTDVSWPRGLEIDVGDWYEIEIRKTGSSLRFEIDGYHCVTLGATPHEIEVKIRARSYKVSISPSAK